MNWNEQSLLDVCNNASRIGISGHVRPDGDCIGACMGLYMYLRNVLPNVEVQVYLEKPADIFACIDEIETVDSVYADTEPYDVFIAVDCSPDRMGEAEKYYRKAKFTINIDHHISNAEGCGMVNYIDPKASSASELIYRLVKDSYLDASIAKALYIGIIHDTGVLQYSNTSPETLETVAALIRFGFNFTRLIDETFYQKTPIQSRLLGEALSKVTLALDGACAWLVIRQADLQAIGAASSDLEGIVSQMRYIKGVHCAVFLHELEDGRFKVSLRSDELVNAAEIASGHGGGGHVRAAGVTLDGPAESITDMLVHEIGEQLTDVI